MKLIDLLADYWHLDNRGIIYAEANPKWHPHSEAVLHRNRDGTTQPIQVGAVQLEYMLEVSIAKDVIRVWREWRGGRKPTPAEMCEAVIYYAEHDAFLEVYDEQESSHE